MSDAGRWRWRHLLALPYRLGFFLAMVVLGASALWWAGVQLQRSGVIAPLPTAVPPSLVHAAVMTFGFFPLFFSGFLFTAGPRWLHVPRPDTRELQPAFLAQAAGWLAWLAGSPVSSVLAAAGMMLGAAGLLATVLRFWRLVRASRDQDRVHAIVIGSALSLGSACAAATALATLLQRPDLARLFVLTALWATVVVVFVTAGHRMVPFFSAPPGSAMERHGDWWPLAVLVGIAALEAAGVWLDRVRWWSVAAGLVELAAAVLLSWQALSWSSTHRLGNRLMRMLHTGVSWIAAALVLQGATAIASVFGMPMLPLAPLHAFAMGGLGSLMLAMVSRVSASHGGVPVAYDRVVWRLFWGVQAATVLRVAATIPGAPAQVLLTTAACLWAVLMLAWGLRYGSTYGRPPAAPRQR